MSGKKQTFVFILFISLLFSFPFNNVFYPPFSQAETLEEKEARLRRELEEVEREKHRWQLELREKQKESASFERDVAILNAKIKEAEATIRGRNIEIDRLGREINLRLQTIGELDSKIERSKESLSQLIRRTNEIASFSMVEILLSNEDLSQFLIDIDNFESINKAMHSSFEEIRNIRRLLDREKNELGVRQNREADIIKANQAEKRRVQANEEEQKKLLAASRSQERTYEQVIAEKERQAALIRTALFSLRDTAAIPFGDALKYAEEARRLTGVRPAFLLAVITQESNMGANVGTCNRPQDIQKWTDIMPGPEDIAAGRSRRNDQAAFLRITSELGLDPGSLPLSCPWGNGWGGAMGPAQFIPTTWEIYKPKVAALLGTTPNPWNPKDAFLASATYLGELGAAGGGYTAERTAALRYYAGGNWNNPRNAFYGDQVMGHAQRIQETMIDPLNF